MFYEILLGKKSLRLTESRRKSLPQRQFANERVKPEIMFLERAFFPSAGRCNVSVILHVRFGDLAGLGLYDEDWPLTRRGRAAGEDP